MGEYGVTLKVLGQVRAPALPAVTGELRRRLLGAFAANGIELPRPQRVVLAHDRRAGPVRARLARCGPDPGGPLGRLRVAVARDRGPRSAERARSDA